MGGADLGFTSIMLRIQGDWMELAKSQGLQSWASWIHPCFCCGATKEELHSLYEALGVGSLPWLERTAAEYYAACEACETKVVVANEAQRSALLANLVWMQGDIWRGRTVKRVSEAFPHLWSELGSSYLSNSWTSDVSKWFTCRAP